ncbi:hypothetical protein Ddc_12762 [Ditylenchus destructor]|nr:hypothetical protein Ddc_12762 [Ditylenchus destructor]
MEVGKESSSRVQDLRTRGGHCQHHQKGYLQSKAWLEENRAGAIRRRISMDKLPAGVTNKILIYGPCLHPEQVDPEERKGCQRRDLRAYFSQFGQIIHISANIHGDANIAFASCESVSMLPAESNVGNQLSQAAPVSSLSHIQGSVTSYGLASFDKPGSASHKNVSAAKVQSDPPAESNVGNQSPQATASNSTQVQGSVTDCSTISGEWQQSRGLASFDKPGYK